MDDSQEEKKSPIVDWIHPPHSVGELSLWDCLHDARLNSVRFDRHEKELQLEFDVRHIRKFHHLSDNARFLLRFFGVTSVRVTGADSSIETSIAPGEFLERLEAENGRTDTFEADLIQVPGSVALRLFLHVNDEFYPEFIVRAESLSISLSTGGALTLEEFLQLGEAYWEDFAERARKLRDRAASKNLNET